MIFVTTYKVKPFLTKEENAELMEVFGSAGTTSETIAHYIAADGSGGLVISESDDPTVGYRNILNYTQWVQYETKVMLTVDQALPHILDALA